MTLIQNSPKLSHGYATVCLSYTATVMRNRFDFTWQKLLWCREEMQQHADFSPTNKIKSAPACITQLVAVLKGNSLVFLLF